MLLLVEDREKGLSLKRFLPARLPGFTAMYLAKCVLAGQCRVNGEIRSWGFRVRPGETVEFEIDLDAATGRRPENIPLEIVFENDEMLAVHKPTGMLVHPTKHVNSGTLANALAYYLPQRFWFPHRLDRDTSGVLLVAKTARALTIINRAWLRGEVHKTYLALVDGIVAADDLVIEAPISRDGTLKPEWGVREDGKHAKSILHVIKRLGSGRTLVRLEPVTGRTNQLRIHCAHIGHPIMGDALYGLGADRRLFLHALRLECGTGSPDDASRLDATLAEGRDVAHLAPPPRLVFSIEVQADFGELE